MFAMFLTNQIIYCALLRPSNWNLLFNEIYLKKLPIPEIKFNTIKNNKLKVK